MGVYYGYGMYHPYMKLCCMCTINNDISISASVDKTSQDMRDMELERRLREGEDVGSWKGRKGFIEHTKVCT